MKYLICFCFLISNSLWATQARFVDGKIQFLSYRVNGTDCFTAQERDNQIAAYNMGSGTFSLVVSTYASAKGTETNLSTCAVFSNYSDWQNFQTKAGLITYLSSLKSKLNNLSDFPNDPSYIDLNARYNYLKNYYNTLP